MQTVKTLAEEIGVSKVAINKKIETLGLKDRLIKDNNRYLITDEVADLVRASYKHRGDGHGSTATEKSTTQTESTAQVDVIQVLTDQIKMLNDQLEKKDAEITRQGEQITALIEQLHEKEKSLQGNQLLLANSMGVATQAQDIETDAVDTTDTESEPKRSWWQRVFG